MIGDSRDSERDRDGLRPDAAASEIQRPDLLVQLPGALNGNVEIGQLTMENDFLKKALQHFRDHHPPVVVSGVDACLKKSSKAQRKAKP